MGGCLSDEKGGREAITGGGSNGGAGGGGGGTGSGGRNDAVDLFFRSKGQLPLFSQVELSFSAARLRDRDVLSKSDPMVVAYLSRKDGMLEELGRTEVIMNSLDPAWIEKILVTYHFEMIQRLVFQVFDVDTKYHGIPPKALKLNDQQFLGEASCVLSEIVTKQSWSLTLKLTDNNAADAGARNLGTLTIRAEEAEASKSSVEITFCCSQLENKDLFSKSDPFLRISRIVEFGSSIPICKTEVVNNNLNPTWKPLCLSMQQFGSKQNLLVIECFDFNSNGNHVLIGKVQKSVSDLEKLYLEKSGANLSLPATSHQGQEKVLKSQLFINQYSEKQQFTFLDYISSGFELNFMVAIDFTASNGNPRTPDSLHYIDPSGRLNPYQRAIMEVGEVIQFYDSDRRFPAWGFGGKTYDEKVSHCFNLNGSANSFEVEGVEGIMAAYSIALNHVALAGPTLFGHVINTAAHIARQSQNDDHIKYYVLLIITDGVLTDLQETKDELVKASDLPLSILIVGVGGADFTAMKLLDADDGHRLQSSTDRVATRDIVQFVPMQDIHDGSISAVQALLEELPGQFLSYMRSRDIQPLTPTAGRS
ncbi:hypothetical protein MLD38_018059 [Melastoma candidum]|uniref:Uncharacterized protein n=1 Tax=Melastoma candidum TaxID=119954 RepID=A0ACB9QTR6_9MYRT|nr:hypothetical protein MLD38_018059 [Melastoma candidum]